MQGFTEMTDLPDRSRLRARVLIVVALAIAVLASTAFVPADATTEGGDLEDVRATVLETYNYKIGLLTNLKAETEDGDRKAVYQAGINELTTLRDTRVATEDNIDELWALKERAHAIYQETVNTAAEVGVTPEEELARAKQKARDTVAYKIRLLEEWIEGCDNPDARAIVAAGVKELEGLFAKIDAATNPDEAYALKDKAHAIYHSTIDRAEEAKGDAPKDEEPKEEEKSEAEKAAEALAAARRSTLSLIERKAAILRSTASAAMIPAVVEIYESAAEEVAALTDDAKNAKSVSDLKKINERVMAIYEEAKAEAADVRDDDEGTEPLETVTTYLDRIVTYVVSTTEAAAATADTSPGTYEALVEAKQDVLSQVERVRDVAESGNRLGDRWEALEDALRDYRRALITHYIALGEPALIRGIQIPG